MSNKYFYVHNGLTVGPLSVDASNGSILTSGVFTSTSNTAATTATINLAGSGALQVAGGASIQGALYAGNIYDNGNRVLTASSVGGAGVGSITAGTDTAVSSTTGNVTVYSTATLATVTGRAGPGYAAGVTPNAISITSTAQSANTNSGQALLVTGGIGANIGVFGTVKTLDPVTASTFAGPVTFGGNVTFNGSATYVYSTQTAYTDNLLELHVPPGGVGAQWQSSDSKDIGLRFHYYTNSTDTNAALILDQTAGSLEWYSSGAESTTSVFTSATYGIFKTGGITLTNTTGTTGVGTGALQVAGGVYVGGGLYVANVITATTFVGSFSGTATTANDLSGGAAGQLVIQDGTGSTTFVPTGTSGQILLAGTNTATWVTTSSYIVGNANAVLNAPTTTAANYYLHFVGANTASYQTPGTTSTVYVDPSTGYLTATRFVGSGAGLSATSVPNSALVNSSITVTAGTGLNGGGTVALGSTVTLGNNGVTSFSGGTTGLTPNSATTGSVTLAGVLSLASGGTSATLVASAGSVVYGTATAMAFNTAGTAGQLLVSAGTNAPAFTNTATIRVGFADTSTNATNATNLLGGSQGGIPIQSGSGATQFIPLGTSGYVLTAGATTATWSALGGLTAGSSTTATNIANGVAGSIPIQNAAGSTTFISSGTVNQLLVQGTNTATWVTANTVTVGTATNVSGGYVTATTAVFSGVTTVTNTVGVSSTLTGALQVGGGAGIGGGLYVGGISTFTNNVVVSSSAIVYNQTGISVDTVATSIDTFALATYRSAKYVLTVSNSGNTTYQSTEVLVIHDGTTPYLQDVSVFTTASPIMTFTVIVNSGNIVLQGTGTVTGNTVKVQKIYTTV
ncbi:MAG: hypothetical protein WCP55_01580 [Lentisphaerota bacterium]